MPLNLIKLCVGCDSVQDLEGWIKERLAEKRKKGEKPEHIHRTRMVPKRAVELVDADGNKYDLTGKAAFSLCRCGGSVNKPFCDGTHSKIGFQAAERAVAEALKQEPAPQEPPKQS